MTTYAIAHKLIGFSSSDLRVKVTRIDGQNAFVSTADLRDAGTQLVLDVSQIEYEKEIEVEMHKVGLVAFA